MAQTFVNFHSRFATNELLDKILLFAIYGLFLLLPWYPYYPGQVQPVDFLVLITAILFFANKKIMNVQALVHEKSYCILISLTGYLSIRYFIAYINNNNTLDQFYPNVYYAVLATLFIYMFFYLYESRSKQEFYQIILNCLMITTILPVATLLIYGSDYGLAELKRAEPTVCRPVLTFYNANQLGFFTLINLSVFYYMTLFAQTQKLKINKIMSLICININVILLLVSVSRAAAPGFILYCLAYPLIFELQLINKHPKIFWSSLGALSIVWLGSIYTYHHLVLPKVTINQATDPGFLADLYYRSFKGISNDFSTLKLFLFGNGSFFNPARIEHIEYHNNFVSLFNQVGVLGLLMYAYLVLDILWRLFKKGLLYAMPFLCYLFYSELHYAFRTRMNWLFFAIVIFTLIYQNLTTTND